MSDRTIAAVATAPGVGGIGVIRVSGPQASAIGRTITGRRLRPRRATFCSFAADDGTRIDQGIALWFPGPRSFTGEDILELHGHGGPIVMDMLLARCQDLGALQAKPGEFSERAFLNGKLDLAQAEATADLIESATCMGARLAMRSLQGTFSRRVDALLDGLIRIRALLEATLDFPEEDFEPKIHLSFQADLHALIQAADEILALACQGERIRDGITVVIAGRTNAGKSSLLNALTQSDAAIVTAVPGTTRDLLRCEIEIDGLPVKLVDTAGIRDTLEPVEQEGVRRAREQIQHADHLLWVYDSSVGLSAEELAELPPDIPTTLVRNKIDLEPAEIGPGLKHLGSALSVSALTSDGLSDLRQHIRATAGIDGRGEGLFGARRRHLDALRRGLVALGSAKAGFGLNRGPEVIAFELLQAQHAFGEITGVFTPNDLLTRVFSTFCIGK